MSRRCIPLLAACTSLLGFAAGASAQMTHGASSAPPTSAAPFGSPVDDQHIFYHVLLNELEGRFGTSNSFRWSGEAWAGTDENRIWLRSEGFLTNGQLEDGQQELFYSRPISTYFDAKIGARYDLDSLPGRGWGALGIEGLAPLFFRVAATGYVSGDGHLAAKLEGSYDLLITQRLILQPLVEMNFYTKDDPARQLGSGLSDIDAGLRLRYEITRKFAPYVGVTYDGKFGGTAAYARANGAPTDELRVAVGVRAWF
jgi:copper resistance protein B